MTLRPDFIVERFIELEPAALAAAGIRGIIFDLDNTLWAADTTWLDPETETALRAWMEAFPGRIAVVTNKILQRDAIKLRTLLARMHIIGLITGPLLKPFPSTLKRAAQLLGVQPSETLVVGDFYLADVVGGKLAGMKTALTTPMGRDEGIVANLLRPIDTWVASRYRTSRQ